MKITHESLIGTFEQKKALVADFNLLSDDFFSVVMKDKAACEYVLSVLLGEKVKVRQTRTQYAIRNLTGHSVVLDVLVENSENKLCNVEIQVKDNDEHIRRVRYYQAAIDWSMLEKGTKYEELPDLYLLYISRFDIFKQSKCCYEIDRVVKGTDIVADNGVHEMYFNTTADDGSALSDMLHYFENSDPNNTKFGALSEAVRHYKNDERGVSDMCEAVREYGDERAAKAMADGEIKGKIKTINEFLKAGMPLEEVLKISKIDEKTYREYMDKYADEE